MRLCHIVPSLAAEHGGPSKSVRALCRALADTSHEVELLATDPAASRGGQSASEGHLIVRLFKREWPQRLCRSPGLRAAVNASAAQVFHHHALWLRTLNYARRRADLRNAKLVISPRGMMSSWAWQYHRGRKRLAERLVHPGAFAAAAGWHATSQEEAQEIRALGFQQPICVAPNGVERPNSGESVRAAEFWRDKSGAGERPVALFYSRFHRKKRVLELIDLWLAAGPADWLLLLVGIPQDYTADELEAHARKMSAGDRVRAFSGATLPAPFPVASLFLLPSHNENFGLAIAEAMAHAVPVVVTDTTPWKSINSSGLGWCVPWADYGQVLAAATRESRAQLQTRGIAAQAWVLREYAWEQSAAKLGAFYASLTASTP